MTRRSLLTIVAALLFCPACVQAQDCNLVGAWEVVSLTLTDPDGTVHEIEIKDPPGLKILNETHWIFVEMTGEEGNPTSGGGGTYVVEGNTYTEQVLYHAALDYIGKTISFECRMLEDGWYQRGLLPDGVLLEEVYRRAQAP